MCSVPTKNSQDEKKAKSNRLPKEGSQKKSTKTKKKKALQGMNVRRNFRKGKGKTRKNLGNGKLRGSCKSKRVVVSVSPEKKKTNGNYLEKVQDC